MDTNVWLEKNILFPPDIPPDPSSWPNFRYGAVEKTLAKIVPLYPLWFNDQSVAIFEMMMIELMKKMEASRGKSIVIVRRWDTTNVHKVAHTF